MLMLLSCYAFLPTPRGVPASGTVLPMRSNGLRSAGAGTACRCQQLKMGPKQLPPEQENPLKWPACASLGKELCDSVLPALRLLTSDGQPSDKATIDPTVDSPQSIEAARQTAMAELDAVADWLDAPCFATVKLDGTNVGIDGGACRQYYAPLLVGRNYVVPPEQLYQKVDVHKLLSEVPAKINRLIDELELDSLCINPAFDWWGNSQVMLYGELIVNQGKYDYEAAGIFGQWFCFGVLISSRRYPINGMEPEKYIGYVTWLTARLQAAGYNCHLDYQDLQPLIRIGPNEKLMSLLHALGISTVSHDYQPRQGKLLTETESAQWADHIGTNWRLPKFASLRELILSEWASRFFMPASQGRPLGEGLVVCSEPNAKLSKWKHGGEEAPSWVAGNTPAKLAEAVELLRGLQGNPMLPPGLLEICERLQLVATSGSGPKKTKAAGVKEKKDIKAKAGMDALAAWSSTLTKFDTLEATFSKGLEAKMALEGTLIEQVALDLETDYGYEPSKARARATGVVKTEMGKRYGQWKRETDSEADSA